jgi:hypothetical protein
MVYQWRFKLDDDFKCTCMAYDPGIWSVLLRNGQRKCILITSTLIRYVCFDHHLSGTYRSFHAKTNCCGSFWDIHSRSPKQGQRTSATVQISFSKGYSLSQTALSQTFYFASFRVCSEPLHLPSLLALLPNEAASYLQPCLFSFGLPWSMILSLRGHGIQMVGQTEWELWTSLEERQFT